MIRLVHFADVHLGIENYGRLDPSTGLSTRVADFLRALDKVVDFAIQEEVDLVLFAGDAFKTRTPSPTYQREFARRIHRLSQAGLPTVLVVGNHDLPSSVGRAHTMEIFATLEVENIHVVRRPDLLRIQTRHGPVQVVALPWVTRSTLLAREQYRSKSLAELNELILKRLLDIFEAPEEGLIARLDPDIPAVLCVHGSVQGATYGSERSVMLGQDVILPLSLVHNPAWDYVALGHIHKHQVLGENPPVVYSGSIERIDFGEEKEAKGFVVAEVERGRTAWEFVDVEARPFVTVDVEANGDDPTAQVVAAIAHHDIADAVVRVIIHTTPDREALLRDESIYQALRPAFHVAGIIRDVKRQVRLRLGEGAIEKMTPRQLLERYFQARQVPPQRIEVLMKYADEILGEGETGD